MNVYVREIEMEPSKNRKDKNYVFFEEGKFSKPLFILNEYEMRRLIEEIQDQVEV